MSRLEELIQELCPDGVEFVKLGEIAAISRGGNLQKRDFRSEGVPCVHYGQIYTRYGLFADTTFTFISEDCAKKQKLAYPNDIIMAVTSENIEDVCKCVAWLGDSEVAVSGHTAIIRHNQNAKYLTYYFHTEMFAAQKRKLVHGTKVMEVTPDSLNSVIVPVPPLPIQAEIVRILDNFTERTTELAEQLTAELTARKKQYEYYRDKLLTFGVHGGGASDAVWRTLADLGKWSGGKTPSMSEHDYWAAGKIPWLTSKDMKCSTLTDTQDHITEIAVKNASMTLYPKNSIAIVTRSGILKHTFPVAYVPFSTTVNQDIKVLEVNETVIPRYAFHLLQGKGQDILARTKKQGGTVDSLDFQKLLTYKVPVPPLSIQQRIVNVLDNFDAVCTDLKISLPAEIEARQKQYEYYRDLLLSFDDCSQLVHVERERERERRNAET